MCSREKSTRFNYILNIPGWWHKKMLLLKKTIFQSLNNVSITESIQQFHVRSLELHEVIVFCFFLKKKSFKPKVAIGLNCARKQNLVSRQSPQNSCHQFRSSEVIWSQSTFRHWVIGFNNEQTNWPISGWSVQIWALLAVWQIDL